MRAIFLGTPGDGPGSLDVIDHPVPEPGPGQVRVNVAYGGCNFADTMMWRGTYPHPKGYPLVAGLEMAGRVDAVGAGVEGVAIGDRVAAFIEEAGAFADFCIVDAQRLIPLPDGVGLDQAAAFTVQALTAWHMLHNVSKVQAGDIVLVHAIGGGVGLYLTQMAVAAGATVIGTIGTPGKEARPLELGATAVVNRNETDFVAAVAEIAGRPIDKIYDSTGATILDRSFELIRQLGHVVSFGEAEGRPLPNLWERLVRKSLTFTRFHLGHVDFSSDIWKQSLPVVTGAIAEGRLTVPIEGVFPLDDVAAMYARLESRQVPGKLVLAINPDL